MPDSCLPGATRKAPKNLSTHEIRWRTKLFPQFVGDVVAWTVAGGFYGAGTDGWFYGGQTDECRSWVVHRPREDHSIQVPCILTDQINTEAGWVPYNPPSVVMVEIPTGHIISLPYDQTAGLSEPPLQDGTGVQYVARSRSLAILQIDLISDLDNDGQITSADNALRDAANKTDATDEQKDKGTEFMFANDQLSNGAWDKEDGDTPGKPSDADDDDAEEIQIKLTGLPDAAEVWLEHPAIAGLSFYTSRKCLAAENVNLSPSQHYIVSSTNPVSKLATLYVRADGAITFPADDPQVAGDLVLMLKPNTTAEALEGVRMKFTVVREMRAKKYFQAVRDYIFENNTTLRVDDKKFPEGSSSPTNTIRLCLMREEATKMVPFESYWDDAYQGFLASNPPAGTPFEPEVYTSYGFGIDGALAADPSMTVVINGNQCDLTDPSLPTEADARRNYLSGFALMGETNLSDRCHGRDIINGRKNQSSSDLDDPSLFAAGTSYRGSVLAGEDPISGTTAEAGGKYVAQYADGHFEIAKGRVPWPSVPGTVPTTPQPSNAMGGLSGHYSDPARNDFPNSFVGLAPLQEHGKGVVFGCYGNWRGVNRLDGGLVCPGRRESECAVT